MTVSLQRQSVDSSDYRAFIWTEAAGVRGLRSTLETAGVITTGWTCNTPWSTSRDGRSAAGVGARGGLTTAYRMVLPE
jgi:hypothetical protein